EDKEDKEDKSGEHSGAAPRRRSAYAWSRMKVGIWLGLATSLSLACAGAGWPDEPGVPVAPSYVRNGRAAAVFHETLVARRAGTTVPAPFLTDSLQRWLRPLAERLQAGEASVGKTLEMSKRWGRSAYHHDVDAWVLDCAKGRDMWLPSELVSGPTAVISYAAATFRPRSLPTEQCAIIVVLANGSDTVSMKSLGPR
ncbi:MAG: hypothetical protein JWM82_3273, partial [Myxococcales bacterium]|nr:hypothetical protein [Myxococcales bacterium]